MMNCKKACFRPEHIRILSESLHDFEVGQIISLIAEYVKNGTTPDPVTTSRQVYLGFRFLKLEVDLCEDGEA